jgi:hypothetical protein
MKNVNVQLSFLIRAIRASDKGHMPDELKSGQVSKLISKKNNEMIFKKMSFECMLLY